MALTIWLDELIQLPLETVRAYELVLKFDDFPELRDPARAEEYLRRCVIEAKASKLVPLVACAEMLEGHWAGVDPLAPHPHLERPAGRIQLAHPGAKRRARGYRSARNYKAIIYLVVGNLNSGPAMATCSASPTQNSEGPFFIRCQRHFAVHNTALTPIYAELAGLAVPLGFHAGPTWGDSWPLTMDRFTAVRRPPIGSHYV